MRSLWLRFQDAIMIPWPVFLALMATLVFIGMRCP